MQRRHLLQATTAALLAAPVWLRAQAIEKTRLTLAVGGKNLLYYLPLTIAEQHGYFKDDGLAVTIVDFAGGARALQAVVGGSADVVSGAFEHTVNKQAKGQRMRAFVLQGRAPQIVLGVNPKTMPNFKTVADLKGKKIGVTAPGSSTNVMVNFILAKAGLKPSAAERGRRAAGAQNGQRAGLRSAAGQRQHARRLANARMLGANRKQLLRHVYLPSATSWVFSSLHTSVGLAVVGAVVGEYLGSSQGVGCLILQAEGTFDINTVMAGILVLTAFALVIDAAVGRVERHLMKWQPRAGETEKL